MDEQAQEPMSTGKKLGFAGGAVVAATVLFHEAPAFSPEIQRFFKWVERVEKKRATQKLEPRR